MNVDQCFSFVNFLARKNQLGSISPIEFEQAFNYSQKGEFNRLLGDITTRPHLALGQNERIAERLKPFKITDFPISVADQIATYPTGFQAITLMTDEATKLAIEYMEDAKLSGRLKSVIDPIASANPAVYTIANTGWKIYPATVNTVRVSYYGLPVDVKWNYAADGNGRPVYNAVGSVQPLWDDVSIVEILAAACKILGFSFEKQSLVQFGNDVKTNGI